VRSLGCLLLGLREYELHKGGVEEGVHHGTENQPRKVALSLEDKRKGAYERVGSLKLEPGAVLEVHLEQVRFPLFVLKELFINEDGSPGVLYLASSDPTLDHERMSTIYHRRWKVEEYHKSLKSNATLWPNLRARLRERNPTTSSVPSTPW
jgi:hypothetical protein